MSTAELCYLAPGALQFFRHGIDLRLTIKDDRSYPSVRIVRLFPISDPQRYLSLRSGGAEVGVLVDPSLLEPDGRRLVDEELKRRYLVTAIRRVRGIQERFATLDWDVETDRGRCRFTTRGLRENTTSPSPNRYLLTDVDGNRHDLDLTAIDLRSQALVLRHL